jgi:hypothetical protein
VVGLPTATKRSQSITGDDDDYVEIKNIKKNIKKQQRNPVSTIIIYLTFHREWRVSLVLTKFIA